MNLSQQNNIDWQKLQSLNGTQVKQLLELLEPKSLKYSPHVPTPKQQVFMNLTCREAFFGGAAGGGKSDALLMDALQYVDIKGFAGIIFRKTFADLVKPGALIDRAKEWLAPFDNVRWREKDRKFEFIERYGRKTDIVSVLQFGYLENENDRYAYQGGEYQYAGFDELVHMSESNYRYLFSRLRRLKGTNIPIKIRGASNPPDDGQGQWVYHRFVNEKTKLKNVIFIPAGMDDNPHLDAEEYSKMLDELDPVTRARLKDGVWTISRKGNMFKREWLRPVELYTLPAYRKKVRYWDLAATELTPNQRKRKEDPDFSVGFLLSECNGSYIIEDIEHFRGSPQEVEARVARVAKRDGYAVAIRMEEEPGSSGKLNTYNFSKILKGYNFKGVRSLTDKVTRANPVSAASERGDIGYLPDCRNLQEFFDEMEGFPGAPHDDFVDGYSGAFNSLNQSVSAGVPLDTVASNGSYWTDNDECEYYEDKVVDLRNYWGAI